MPIPCLKMVEVLRNGKWVASDTIPQGLGTVWRSKDYVHGPRVRQPEQFSKLYVFSINRAKARHIPLIKKPKDATKAKVGPLKSSGRLAVQSYLTVRTHLRRGKLIYNYRRRHRRMMPSMLVEVYEETLRVDIRRI